MQVLLLLTGVHSQILEPTVRAGARDELDDDGRRLRVDVGVIARLRQLASGRVVSENDVLHASPNAAVEPELRLTFVVQEDGKVMCSLVLADGDDVDRAPLDLRGAERSGSGRTPGLMAH